MRSTASIRFACPSTQFVPGRRVRVLEVRHEDLRARVERVDHHLPIGRARDLDAPVLEVGGRLGDAPLAGPRGCAPSAGGSRGSAALVDLACRSSARASSSSRRGPSSRWSVATNSSAVGRQDALGRRPRIRQYVDTPRDRRRHSHRLTRVALPRAFVEAVEAALPGPALLTEPEELRTYECDGLTGRRVIPALVCLPQTTDEVQAVVRACAAHGIPFVARGAGTGLSGGALPVAEGVVISLARMNRVLAVDLDAERVVVEPGVTNLRVTEAVAADGLLLRAGSFEPAGVHDRRQRGRELGRRALPEERLHRPPRARGRRRAPGRRGRERWRPRRRAGRARRVRRRARAPSGSRPRSRSVCCGGRSSSSRCSPLSIDGRGRRGGLRRDRRGDPARGGRDDGPADDRGRGGRRAGLSDGGGGGADRRARRRRRAGGGGRGAGRGRSAESAARPRSGPLRTTRSARCSGRGGDRRSPRWAGSPGATTCRTASSRARSCPRCCAGSHGSRPSTGSASATSSMRATATSTRSCSTTSVCRGAGAGARTGRRDPRRLRRRRRLDHWRARRRHGQGMLDAAALLQKRPRGDDSRAPRLRPGRDREPRQAVPDASPLR